MKKIRNEKKMEHESRFRAFLEQGSFYSLLLRNYAGLTLMAFLLGFLIIISELFLVGMMFKMPKTEILKKQESLLKEERYRQLSTRIFLEENSYLEVLDEDCNVIYTDKRGEKNTYSKEEVTYIPELMGDSYLVAEPIFNKNGTTELLIVKYINYNAEERTSDSKADGVVELDRGHNYQAESVVILDAKRNILYASVDMEETHLTEKELNYWQGIADSGYHIQKYDFTTQKGENRTLILYTSQISDAVQDTVARISRAAFPVFVIFFILLLLLFVFRINRKVKQPLEILNRAMQELSAGKRNEQIYYTGPKEFEQICDNFNKMSVRLNESERQRRRMEEDKQKMLADISHDLKTPITVIQGYSKAIYDDVIPMESRKKYLLTIYRKSNTLSELINSFYEYSRLEHPQFTLVKDEGDVCEYLREYIASKYEELELAGFLVSIDLPEKAVWMEFDHLQLKRVFENIISNAIKHNVRGTKIKVSLKEEKNEVIIAIGDNGTGIPKEIRDRIFEPFVVGDESRNSRQGTGLGLAISKKIVKVHGGTITLLEPSADGLVTVFEIRLPLNAGRWKNEIQNINPANVK